MENTSLEDKFQKIHSELAKFLNNVKRIYHYTDFNGLTNILKQRKLRFTDYRYFNDPTEIEFGKKIIQHCLLRKKLKEYIPINKLFNDLHNQLSIYVACFSKEINKLALWRYYAANGTGFAIGFNEGYFYPAKENNDLISKSFIGDVVYGNKNTIKLVKKFLQDYVNYDSNDQNLSTLIRHLISILPFLKDISYDDEHEIRIIHLEGNLIRNTKSGEPFYYNDEYRAFIDLPIVKTPFVNSVQGKKPVLTPEEFCKKDISEIWVGPSCNFIETRKCIRRILQENEYDINQIDIKHCKVPYRTI